MAHTPIDDCLKAIQFLYLEVDSSIADDVKAKVLAALEEAFKAGRKKVLNPDPVSITDESFKYDSLDDYLNNK